jgi:UDP-N-acetylglucosamine 2-epimerase (non-hydrolysing)
MGGLMKKVMLVYGTRPEAVKVAPLIKALENSDVLAPIVVSTGQHRDMLAPINEWFGIVPDLDLDVFAPGATLTELSARILQGLPEVLTRYNPDAVVVQGDTTTVAIAAIACFYHHVPVVHLEAGLRSGDILSPFPEEANRRLTGQVAALHLAPTPLARDNLLREMVDPANIAVVGNTVIDALAWSAQREASFSDERLVEAERSGRPMVLLTAHRRENLGAPMTRIAAAVAALAARLPEYCFVFPAHKNPKVRDSIVPTIDAFDNVIVCEPLNYPEFVHAQQWAEVILTDSGGVQEEAPSLGKPVLVLRENTERPEAVHAGTVRLIGTQTADIVAETMRLIEDRAAHDAMAEAVNPYGDGHAADRSVAAIASLLGVGERLPEFAG